jgi:hypothetical protein
MVYYYSNTLPELLPSSFLETGVSPQTKPTHLISIDKTISGKKLWI